MATTSGPFQSGTLDVWPNAEALVVSWLAENMPDVNVRTETDPTFGTSQAIPSMTLPLVLVTMVTSGTANSPFTQLSNIDIASYGSTRKEAWDLYARTHAWMLRAAMQSTPLGHFDSVELHDQLGIVQDTNPNLRRVIATYGIATRAQAYLA